MVIRVILFILLFCCKSAISQKIGNCDTTREFKHYNFEGILKYQNTFFYCEVKKYEYNEDTLILSISFCNQSTNSLYIADNLTISKLDKLLYINSILRIEPTEHHYSDTFTKYDYNEIFKWEKKVKKLEVEEVSISLEFSYNIDKLKENHGYKPSYIDGRESVKIRGLSEDFIHCGLEVLDIFSIKTNINPCDVIINHTKVY
jgi:hypothetical protein